MNAETYYTETVLSIMLRSKFPRSVPSYHNEFPLTEIEQFHITATLGLNPEMKPSPYPGIFCNDIKNNYIEVYKTI